MPNILAALASVLWGTADFLGGLAAKDRSAERVGIITQSVSLVLVAAALPLVTAEPETSDLWWGVLAGVATAMGITVLYRSLAIGPMHTVAPIAAVVGASVSTASGLIGGERPSAKTLAGVLLALVAVGLIGMPSRAGVPVHISVRRVLPLAGLAGLALGCVNVSFAATSPASGIWPIAVSRAVALLLLLALGAAWRGQRAPSGGSRALAVGAGVSDVAATTSISLALQRGSLVQVGVLASMFPAITVLLARVVLQERVGRGQLLGLVCALAAVGMMAAG